MPDSRCDAVRPVIEANAVVRGSCEGGRILEHDFRVLLLPAETFLANVLEYAVVLFFDALRPFYVASEMRGEALEKLKPVVLWTMN